MNKKNIDIRLSSNHGRRHQQSKKHVREQVVCKAKQKIGNKESKDGKAEDVQSIFGDREIRVVAVEAHGERDIRSSISFSHLHRSLINKKKKSFSSSLIG